MFSGAVEHTGTGERHDTGGSFDAVIVNNHRAIMQRGVRVKNLEQQLRRLYLRMDGLHRGGDESEAEPLAALADILEEKKEAWQRGNGQ